MASVKPYGLISCQRLNATTAMVGIIYYNAFAGRSGEWENMQREYVVEQIAAGADHFLCNEHKAVSYLFLNHDNSHDVEGDNAR